MFINVSAVRHHFRYFIQPLVSVRLCHNSQLFLLTQLTNTDIRTASRNPFQNTPYYTRASITYIFELPYTAGQLDTTPMYLQLRKRPMIIPSFPECDLCASHVDFVLLCEIFYPRLIDHARSIAVTIERAILFIPADARLMSVFLLCASDLNLCCVSLLYYLDY